MMIGTITATTITTARIGTTSTTNDTLTATEKTMMIMNTTTKDTRK